MKGVDRYYDDYNPGPHAAAGVYDTNNFRENLNELLRLKNLTQEEAAEKCIIPLAKISQWATGVSLPDLSDFVQLCSGLQGEPNWLLSKHEPIKKRRNVR